MRDNDKPGRGKSGFGGRPKPGGKPKPEMRDRRGRPGAEGKSGPAAPAERDEAADSGRIAKILARAGVASRRDAERMVLEGRVKVNGKLVETPATVVSVADKIEVDGEQIAAIERTRLWIYHKPAGLVTTNKDPEGRPTVFENLPDGLPRVVTVGRLDINTEGLLLLTNDGGLSRALELPSTGWLRRYRVRAHGEIDQETLDGLKEGIAVEGVLYGAIEATLDRTQGHNVWLTMGLREGKNREIKNVLGHLGLEVNRLIRLSFGPFQLGDLPIGEVIEIKSRTLRDQLGPKLIEEAGLNFEAPMVDHKPKPVADAEKPSRGEREKPAEREWISASDRRERARDRLETRADAFDKRGKPGGKGGRDGDSRSGDKPDKRRAAPRRNRSTNVWMAPGAKPVGPKKEQESEARKERFAGQPERPAGKPGRSAGKPAGSRGRSDDARSRREGDGRAERPGSGFAPRGGNRPTGKTGKPADRPGDTPRGGNRPTGKTQRPDDRKPSKGPGRGGPSGRGGPGADRRR